MGLRPRRHRSLLFASPQLKQLDDQKGISQFLIIEARWPADKPSDFTEAIQIRVHNRRISKDFIEPLLKHGASRRSHL